jgi:hypothetical protein
MRHLTKQLERRKDLFCLWLHRALSMITWPCALEQDIMAVVGAVAKEILHLIADRKQRGV